MDPTPRGVARRETPPAAAPRPVGRHTTTPAPPGAGVVRRRRPGQAFARLNVRDAIQTAMTASTAVIATPIRISGLPQSLLNRARAASVACVSGLRLLRNRSQ